MSYYGDGIPYYYGGGPFANHSSLMTGTGRLHTPLRYAPHLSTISESPLSTYRRYSPVVLPCRPRRIIDTADIDVSTPRTLQSNHSHQGLRRDRPTIRIRSQALKDNPTLRDHVERREKTVGELLVEKFLIKDKKLSPEDIKMKMYRQTNAQTILPPADEKQESIQKRITRRMTRRRSSADVTLDPEQLERQIAMAQVQAEVLDTLVAEEQAEIEVETRKGTLIHKNVVRGASTMLKKTSSSESDDEDTVTEGKRKLQKKMKKRKKTTDKPSPPQNKSSLLTAADGGKKGKMFKVEACNSVGDLSTFLLNANEQQKRLEQYRESIKLPAPKSMSKTPKNAEEIVVLPAKKPYVRDNARNSVYLTLKTQIGKSCVDDVNERDSNDIEAHHSTAHIDDGTSELAKDQSKDNVESDVEVKVAVNTDNSRGDDEIGIGWVKNEATQNDLIELTRVSECKQDSTTVTELPCPVVNSNNVACTNISVDGAIREDLKIGGEPVSSNDIDVTLLREVSQEDFKSTSSVESNKTISLAKNLTWDSREGEKKAERTKRRKKKTLGEDEGEGLVDVNSAKNPEIQNKNERYELKSESLPIVTTTINFESNLVSDLPTELHDNGFTEKNTDESIINEQIVEVINRCNDSKNVFVSVKDSVAEKKNFTTVIENSSDIDRCVTTIDNNKPEDLICSTQHGINSIVLDKIERTDSINDNNNTKIAELNNLSKILDTNFVADVHHDDEPEKLKHTDEVSHTSETNILPKVKPKNKCLVHLKDSSTDSGVGSLDTEPRKKLTENKVKKKLLKNSKGSSFECDDETRVKPIIEKKLKNKFVSSKSSSLESEEELKQEPAIAPDVSRDDNVVISEDKERATNNFETASGDSISKTSNADNEKISKVLTTKLLPTVHEESKKSEQETKNNKLGKKSVEDVDFWSEIKSVETKPPKFEKTENFSEKTLASETPLIPTSTSLPAIDEVKPDTPTVGLSTGLVVKKKKKIKCSEKPVKTEKKERTAEIIFDTATPDKLKHNTDVKSSKNSQSNKIIKKLETLLEEPVKLKTVDNQENDKIMDAKLSSLQKKSFDKTDVADVKIHDTLSAESPDLTDDTTVPTIKILTPLHIPEPNITDDKVHDDDKDDDDDEPKTPTNEEDNSDPNSNMSKWNGSSNLTTLNGKEVASSTNETVIEAVGSTTASPQTSGKKKLGRRKKSSAKSVESTIIRKIPEERSSNSSDTTLKPGLFTTPKVSPVNSPKKTRPVDLMKMFYTTPASLLTATPRDLSKVKRAKIKRRKHSTRTPSASSDSTGSTTSTQSTGTAESTRSNSTEVEDEAEQKRISSTRSNDSGFDGSPRLSNCDMACHKKCEKLTGNLCGLNQKLVAEALQALKRAPSQSSDNQRSSDGSDHVHGGGRITPPATNLPRFKKYVVEDFNFLKVLGKGSFGKVLLAELRGTDCVYAVKCLKKDVVLEDDDVECTLIERKVLTLATRHPYLCHLFCTFQTESHLFFVMEYLNGGDLMFHIQKSGRFPEFRAKFYAAEIWSGLNFLHKKGIVYRDLKLDNVLLDFEGHIRIADFGMCKLQIFLDRTADTFCGTPDYMAPEIIKGLKYNQSVDWWSFGVLLYEMLTGQSPFSGCDEDELFWSICNERPFIPRYLTQESMDILITLLEKDAGKRLLGHEIQSHTFFHNIHWDRLERRLLEPPFKPALDHTLDTKYFDTAFTVERPRLTPVPEQILSSMDQGVFRGFSYTNPNATD